MRHLAFIIPPDLPGKPVDRTLSAGIGVVVPTKLSDRLRRTQPRGTRTIPPMELLYAAGVADQAGLTVSLLDIGLEGWLGPVAVEKATATLPNKQLGDDLWIGVLISMPTLLADVAFAKEVKSRRPDARVFLHGSPIMTTLDLWIDQVKGIDALIFGELEAVIGKMLAANEKNWKKVQGVIDPDGFSPDAARNVFDKSFVTTFDRWERVKQLGELPQPLWRLVPFERYSGTGLAKDCGVHVQASRGCPIGCTMCPYMVHEGRPFRANPADRVVADLKYLNEKYGITHVRFRDPNFGFDKKQMRELAEKIIAADVHLDGAAELSLELLDHESIDLLNKAGIRTILTGIETNDEQCLQSIGQKIKINEYLEEKIEYCNKIGTGVFASFVVGAPEESWHTIKRTVDYAKLIDAQCAATIMTPFPGTPMFYRAIEDGLLKPKMRYGEWNSYTATMRSQFLSCSELTAARLWFRLETLIPFKLRQAKKSGKSGAVATTYLRLAPHIVTRQALRLYIWFRKTVVKTRPLLPQSETQAESMQTRKALWHVRS